MGRHATVEIGEMPVKIACDEPMPMLPMSGPIRKRVIVPGACRERYVPLGHPALAGWVERGIVHSGVSDLVPGYQVGTERQSSFLVIATTAGRGMARTSVGGRHDLVPGTLFIDVPGGASEWATTGRSWSLVWWYILDQPRWRGLAAGGPRVRGSDRCDFLWHAEHALIACLAPGRATGPSAAGLAAQLADALLAHLLDMAGSPPVSAEPDPLAALWDEVRGRLHEPWPLSHLAARLHVSVATLQRQVRARHRAGVHRVLLGLRMARAEELLLHTAYPLRVIAGLVGFADQFGFSSAFRRHRGCSPTGFRSRGVSPPARGR